MASLWLKWIVSVHFFHDRSPRRPANYAHRPLTGFRKLVVGRNHWRIVYRIVEGGAVEVCEVWCVGVRSDSEVYAEAAARVTGAAAPGPELRRLADVIDRLGRLAGGVVVQDEPPGE